MKPELLRGIDDVIVRTEVESALKAGRKLRLKFGVDPTSPDIHLGHAVLLRHLRLWQDMGHTVIFLMGDCTARIGDPSGRNVTRPVLDDATIKANVKTYLDQVGRILDVDKAEIRYNSEWLDKLKFTDVLKLASQFTVAQLIEREDFKTRLEAGQDLGLHELLYPAMVAYDSVALEADIEFGGTDQRFNLLAGRALQKKMGQRPQQVIISKLLVGTDGEQKMSKSLGNYIGLADTPNDMYGKVMSIPDHLIAVYYELCTDVEDKAIRAMVQTLADGANPRDTKASLAREIVSLYHGEAAALVAEASWDQTFRSGTGPANDQIEEIVLKKGESRALIGFLIKVGSEISNSEAKRLINQRGVKINDGVVDALEAEIKAGDLIQIGKKRFYKIVEK